MKLFEDHAFLLFLALLLVLLSYTIITIVGKPVDEKIIGVGFVVLVGALAGRADAKRSGGD
jgi:hypothetical protein